MMIALWTYNVGHRVHLSASHIIRNGHTLCGHPLGDYKVKEVDVLSCGRCRKIQGEKRTIGRRLLPRPDETEVAAAVAMFRDRGGLIKRLPDGLSKVSRLVRPTNRHQVQNVRGAQ